MGKLPRITSAGKNQRYKRIRGHGGIGRLGGFRFHCVSVQVRVLLPAPKIGDPRQRVADLLFHFNLRQNRISDFWKIVEILKNEAVKKKDCDNNRGHRCILYYVASIKYHSFVDDCYILIQHYRRKCKIMQELFGILRKSWGILPE